MSTNPQQPTVPISAAATATAAATTGTQDNTDTPTLPRDVRILHLILASQSLQSFEDHVPLQLMDFAHRYTSSILKDAVIYNDHTHATHQTNSSTGSVNTHLPGNKLTTDDIRLAIAARTNYQFMPVTPKEMMLELANERNRKALPPVMPGYGLRLPPEKNNDINKRLITSVGLDTFNLGDDVHTFNDFPKDDVSTIQPGGDDSGDEELRTVGVSTSIGHRQDTRLDVLQLEVFISELVAVDGLPTSTVTVGEVTTLDHEGWNDTVEDGVDVTEIGIFRNGQLTEVLSSLWDNITVQTKDNTA
ncbi:hypothetical protein WICPIJ_003919 [Wickerhamomyces pijperi]|uniref:Transcription initiation factor TFIID subunit 9 n=1 Tax=Wickerhamomyces pijperi TaxID=599730 RepID=A0A9P8TNE8_WICPI|nr:hypothetical protein WICPIJ_003919 [Wickerhamomyces pijperi]